MSLLLRANKAATIKRESVSGSRVFDVTVGTVWGRLAPTGGQEDVDEKNVVIAEHKFRYAPGHVAFSEQDQLIIDGLTMNVLLIKDAAGAGKEKVATLREIR